MTRQIETAGGPIITLERYTQLDGDLVVNVIESETDPDGINGEWIACPDNVGPGFTANAERTEWTPPVPAADPCEWLIDIGPFFDRFGAAKMAVLTSADAGVRAIMQDVQVRKWIDLQRLDVATSLAYIGSKVPVVDEALQTAILTTPVATEEHRALRKLYF